MKKKKTGESVSELNGVDIMNASSAQDFTGMMPTPPKTESERESYNEMLNLAPPRKNSRRGK